jgi:hypothetical protein
MTPAPLSHDIPASAPLSPRGMESFGDNAKKTVSWKPIVINHTVESFKKEDGYDLWWTVADISSFRQECRLIVKCMNDMEYFSENDEVCTRGLESKTENGSNMRKMRRVQCAFGVLDEQDFQRQNSIIDDDMISELYVKLCGTASQEAFMRALRDQQIARDYTSNSEGSSMIFKTVDVLSASARIVSDDSMQNRVAGQAA